MPQTYDYKVRDRTGNLVTGQLVGDSESLVLQKLREMGMTPVEVKKANAGLKMEINLRPGPGQAQAGRDLLPAVRHDGELRACRSCGRSRSSADQTESKELAKVLVQARTDVEQGSSLSAAMGKHPKAFNNLFISMVKAGETGGVLDDVLLSARRPDREGGRAPAADQVGDDLPDRRRRAWSC